MVSAPLLPLFLKLEGRPVLVVGGGPVAAGRVRQLIEARARVTVVAPEVRADIHASGASVLERRFEPTDIQGVWLAVAAATAEVNHAVADAAEAARVFVNVVDDPEAASAYSGGVLRKGGVLVAVSTEGRAPALAGLLREVLDALLPEDVDRWVAEAERLRGTHRADGIPLAARRPLLLSALNALYGRREAA